MPGIWYSDVTPSRGDHTSAFCSRDTRASAIAFLTRGDLPQLFPIQYDLAAVAGAHDLKSLFEVAVAEAMRNDRPYIQPGLQQDCHLVPGFVHLPAVNAFDREHVEN